MPYGPYGVNGDEIYFDESLPWVWEDGEDIVIDVDASGGAVWECGDYLVLGA